MNLEQIILKIDSLRSELDKLRPLDPEREQRIMQKFRLDWNFHSNNLEGNSLTFGETKTFLLHGITAQGKPLKDHLDIKGHNEAIRLLEDVVRSERPLTESFIRELHKIILHEPYDSPAVTAEGNPTTKRIQVGQYKSQPNHVKTQTGEIFYFASPEETPAKMNDLMDWFNKAVADKSVHPLVLAAEYHYRFIRIHPFDDGNGRMVRILMNLIFMIKGLPPVIIRTQEKAMYFSALQQADGGNVGAFVSYVGNQLIRSLELMLKGARGEEIEDREDIDKEIALFKASIVKESEINYFTKENVYRVFDENIVPLFTSISGRLSQLVDLFSDHTFFISYSGGNSIPSDTRNVTIDLKQWFRKHYNGELVFQVTLAHILMKYKYPPVRFDCYAILNIEFTDEGYQIESDFPIQKRYGDNLDDSEIYTLVKEQTKKALDRIKEQSANKENI